MDPHVLIVRLRLDSPLARAWSDLLPRRLRVELSTDEIGPLDVQPVYAQDFPRQIESIVTARWTLAYEARQGRAIRVAFHAGRVPPAPFFQEICRAFEAINVFAAGAKPQEAYHFGLALGAKVVLEELWRREAELRLALTPPYATTLI